MSSPSSEAGTAVEGRAVEYKTDEDAHPGKVYEKEKITFRVIILCVLASMGGFIFGYDTGEISGLVAMPDFINRFGTNGGFSNVREGLIVGMLSIGSLIGSITGGPIADRPSIGRRGTIILGCMIFIIGTVIQISSVSAWEQLMIGRLIAGLGVGQLSAIVPLYQSETAPKQIRGTLTSTYQLFITFGILVAYLINFGTVKINNGNSAACWRITIGIGFVWAFFLGLGMLFMPETPRFTLKCGNEAKCRRDMMKIRGVSADNEALNHDIVEMKEALIIDSKLPHGFSEILHGKPKVLYRVLLGASLQMFQQLTGANYFFYYGTTIFKSIALSNSYVSSIILGAVNFGCTFLGLYVVEKFGRRKALITGAIGMACAFIVFASVGYKVIEPGSADSHGNGQPTQTGGYVMIIFGCLFLLFYATTWAPVVWTVNSEMMPSRVRALAIGICTGGGNWTWNFLLSFFTPFITNDIGFRYGYVFAGSVLLGATVVYFFLYETKGLTLEQIDEMYGIEGLKPWQSSSWQPTDKAILYNQRRELLGETEQYKRDQRGAGDEQHVDYVEHSRRGDGTEEAVPGFRSMV